MVTPQPPGLRPGMVFRPSGRQLITLYLGHNALRGELPDALVILGGCVVTAGVDIFAASPDALPFQASHRAPHGEVWGYFAAAAPTADSVQPAPGGCWARDGADKRYELKGEALGYRSRFAFHVMRVEAGGEVMWAPTRWLMKEYRLDEGAAVFRDKLPEHPNANMDFVVRKIFTKPLVPVSLPARSGSIPSGQAQPTRSVRARRKAASSWLARLAIARAGIRHRQWSAPSGLDERNADNLNDNAKVMSCQSWWTRLAEEYNYKVPSGRQIIVEYLGPKATCGRVADSAAPGLVAEGVDIFAVSPDALPFPPSHRKNDEEAWGYFFAAKPVGNNMQSAPGGWWFQYGRAKSYMFRGKVYARHRRFRFHVVGAPGYKLTWEQTPWQMKEYALHQSAWVFRNASKAPAGANMDLVVYKVFTKPVVAPPPRPRPPRRARSSKAKNQARKRAGSGLRSDEPGIVLDIDLNN
ncbi:hypothetical protein ZWY2020_056057 [Hordeum vulgare]|nr:hypothetical protein ZWY2020_056057 [Hordeum vulgare]